MWRPRIRISIAVAIAIVLGAYLTRGLAIRGGDLRPDVPGDYIAFAVLALGIAMVAWMRVQARRSDGTRDDSDMGDEGGSRPGEAPPGPR